MKKKLNFLYIYLTDECNLNCTHCWQSAPLSGKRRYSRLNFDECKNFLEDTMSLGLNNITFSGGEPLINSKFHKFAEYFKRNSIHISIETNGILIPNKKIFNTIKNTDAFCAISLDGAAPETHNKHRGNENAFQHTIRGIKKLENEKIKYQIIMAISKFNYHELIPLLNLIKKNFEYCASFKINVVQNMGRAAQMNEAGLLFKAEELPQITEDIAPLINNYPFKILLHVDPVFFSFKNLMLKYSCGGHCGYEYALSILANGKVSICSLGKQNDKYVLDHVSTINIKDLWKNNPILHEIQENPYLKLKGICAKCIFRKRCLGGCRAKALSTYGDFFAPSPTCEAYYESGNFPKSKLIDAENLS